MPAPFRVLIVEDSDDDAQLLLRELRRSASHVEHQIVHDAPTMARALDDGPWDLVISDFAMPRFTGMAALALARQKDKDLPFILVSGTVGEDIAVQAMKAGASDYLFKGNLARLGPAIEREIRDAATRRDKRRIESQLIDAQRQARLGTWYRDFRADTAVWSEETFRILGVSPLAGGISPGPRFEEFLNCIHPDDRSLLTSVIQSPQVKTWGNDYRVIHADGSLRYVYIHGDIIRGADGKPVEATGTIQDITERKLAEESLRKAHDELAAARDTAEAANRAKDHFLSILSHELRTPLTPVLATVSALESQRHLPDEFRSDLATIRRNVEAEAKLIDDLLELTRLTRGKMKLAFNPVDIHALLAEILDEMRGEIESRNLQVTRRFDAPQPFVRGDRRRLAQAIINLLHNAVRFTPTDGSISIRTAGPASPAAEELTIEISDTGIGIEPQALARLFRPFEQGERTLSRRFGGLGLGLAIAKGLVDLHGGTLTAASPGKDQGSVFTLRLPVASAAGAAPPLPRHAHPEKNGRSILLVEDHVDTLQIMSRLLRSFGHTVQTATSVQSAIEALAHGKFDILISDIGLQDGSGLDIMRHLRSAGSAMKAIAVSGFGMDNDRRRSEEVGFDRHLTKPVTIEKLIAAIDELTAAPSR